MATLTKKAEQAASSEVFARSKFQLISPRKVRRVADLVRGKKALEAEQMLRFMPHKGAKLIGRVLHAAIANAKNNQHLHDNDLVVSSLQIDQGPMLKRFQPRARGRAFSIHRHMSHIRLGVKSR